MTYKQSSLSYLSIVLISLASTMAIFFYWATAKTDHFGAIPLNGDGSYYRSYGDWLARECANGWR